MTITIGHDHTVIEWYNDTITARKPVGCLSSNFIEYSNRELTLNIPQNVINHTPLLNNFVQNPDKLFNLMKEFSDKVQEFIK